MSFNEKSVSSKTARPTRFFTIAQVTSFVTGLAASNKHEPDAIKLDDELVHTDETRNAALRYAGRTFSVFANNTVDDVLTELKTNPKTGLSPDEASLRLAAHGRNELEKEPPTPLWKMFLEQMSDLLVIMLIAASIVSMALAEYASAVTIIIIIVANAILGVVQEARAEAALDALASLAAPRAEVIRGGRIVEIDSQELVPGDIIKLSLGNRVPADIRLVESESFVSNEMALTGEPEGAKKTANWVPLEEEKGGEKKEKHLTEPTMVYMGCTVQDGHGLGVVVKTGMHTKMGEIAHLINTADKGASPLQKKLHGLGVRLGIASIIISVVVFIIGVTTGRGTDEESDQPDWLQMLLVAVSLTVASVPEGLPACVTITLAVGMKNMVKKNALIRNLHSVETLGSASVICTDKTGTLTAGQMTAVRVWYQGETFRITGAGFNPSGFVVPMDVDPNNDAAIKQAAAAIKDGPYSQVLVGGALCSNANLQFNAEENKWEATGNTSERPLVVAAAKIGLDQKILDKSYRRVKENPFNSARKMMSVVVESRDPQSTHFQGAKYFAVVKGAPNVILSKCVAQSIDGNGRPAPLSPAQSADILKVIDGFSEQAYRVLAIAYRPLDSPDDVDADAVEKDLVLMGLVASIDPERREVAGSIVEAYNAGIRVVMITGDYVKTAKAIAENIGLLPRGSPEAKAIDCEIIRTMGSQLDQLNKELDEANVTPERKKQIKEEISQLENRLDAITAYGDVYARAKPVDKITIVRSLQRQGNVCSMTGDGVNDAPALKQANIGVAMGITGTDVAKGAADMVLTDDNFVSIVAAIEEGRTIYANITKFVFYLLSTNVSEVFIILVAVIMGLQSPLLPIQILWMNLTTDGAPAIALAIEATEPGIMNQGPRSLREPILERVMVTGIVIQTMVFTPLAIGTYVLGLYWATDSWDGKNRRMSKSDREDGLREARSMTILLIVFAELLRSHSARGLRASVFSMPRNRWIWPATVTSAVATVLIVVIPGLRDIFELRPIGGKQWAWVLVMCWVPFIVDELTKLAYRITGFGLRPRARDPAAVQVPDKESEERCKAAMVGNVPPPVVGKQQKSNKPKSVFSEDDEKIPV